MARLTDTERGARIARRMAWDRLAQADLFPATVAADRELWQSILDRAEITVAEERECRFQVYRLRWLQGGVH